METLVLPIEVALPSGRHLLVRRTSPDDVDGIDCLYRGLGAEDRQRRFFSMFSPRRHWVAAWVERCLTDGDTIVAVAPDGMIVAEAGYVLLEDGTGEFALTVDSDWRGWLGPYLLDVLVELARSHGVPDLAADVLAMNGPMCALTRMRNAVVVGGDDHTVRRVLVGTEGRQATWPPVRRTGSRGRVLIEAAGLGSCWATPLTRAGFDVLICAGPPPHAGVECAAERGQPCPLLTDADVVVVTVPAPRAAGLVEHHALVHPTVPLVVIGGEAAEGGRDDRCWHLPAGAPAAAVIEAVERAA